MLLNILTEYTETENVWTKKKSKSFSLFSWQDE